MRLDAASRALVVITLPVALHAAGPGPPTDPGAFDPSTGASDLALGPTARTAVASTLAVAPLDQPRNPSPAPGEVVQFLFSAALERPADSPHWRGFLQRTSVGNAATEGGAILGPIENAPGNHGTVNFDALLNAQPRPVDDQGSEYERRIYTFKAGRVVPFTRATVTPADLAVATAAERDRIVDFVRGEPGTPRAENRLGAVLHSSPVILEPPDLVVAPPGYDVFRAHPCLRARPPILFVGSNLGMLHAWNAQSGKEEWAFVPPALLPTLKSQLSGFSWGVDGTPTVRDVQLTTRQPELDPRGLRNWRSVVVASCGWAASATIALDVTDPVWRADNDPPLDMLWQFDQSDAGQARLGVPFATPAIASVLIEDRDAPLPFGVETRAVVLVPGGKKRHGVGLGGNEGENVWALDLATGSVLRRFDLAPGSGGATGACAAVDDLPGSVMTRAFCGDAASNVARLDFTSTDPASWGVDPGWYRVAPRDGRRQPIFAAPAVATRASGNLMLVVGNGDPRDLEATNDATRIAFVEEVPTFDSVTGLPSSFAPVTLRIIDPPPGERLTGTPVVGKGVVSWTTFGPCAEGCAFGQARLYAMDYATVDPAGPPVPALESPCGSDATIDTPDDAPGVALSCLLPPRSVVGSGPRLAARPAIGGPEGELKLVFQTGTADILASSILRDPELTPPDASTITFPSSVPLGSIRLAATRILSWPRSTGK
jgi:hypothetical protein